MSISLLFHPLVTISTGQRSTKKNQQKRINNIMSRQIRARPGPIVWEGHKFTFSYYEGGHIATYRCSKRQSSGCLCVFKHDSRLEENSKWIIGKHIDKCVEATPQLILPNQPSKYIYIISILDLFIVLLFLTSSFVFFALDSVTSVDSCVAS